MNFSHPNKQGVFASKTQNSTMVITLLYVIQGSIKKRMSKSVRFTTAAVNIGMAFFLKEQFSLMHNVFCANIRPIWGVLCSLCRLIIFMRLDSLQTPSLYRLQGSPCVVILPCKDPVKITWYHSNPSSYVVGT